MHYNLTVVDALEANRIINMESTITLCNLIPALCQKNDDEALGFKVVHTLCIFSTVTLYSCKPGIPYYVRSYSLQP